MEDKGGDSDEDRMMSRWKGEGIFFFFFFCCIASASLTISGWFHNA